MYFSVVAISTHQELSRKADHGTFTTAHECQVVQAGFGNISVNYVSKLRTERTTSPSIVRRKGKGLWKNTKIYLCRVLYLNPKKCKQCGFFLKFSLFLWLNLLEDSMNSKAS